MHLNFPNSFVNLNKTIALINVLAHCVGLFVGWQTYWCALYGVRRTNRNSWWKWTVGSRSTKNVSWRRRKRERERVGDKKGFIIPSEIITWTREQSTRKKRLQAWSVSHNVHSRICTHFWLFPFHCFRINWTYALHTQNTYYYYCYLSRGRKRKVFTV